MKNLSAVFFALLLTSCNFFQQKEVSEDELLQQKLREINLNTVDAFPLFAHCSENDSLPQQQQCFETAIISEFYKVLATQQFTVQNELNDTIYLFITVTKKGNIVLDKTHQSQTIQKLIPNLDSILQSKTDEFPAITPAKKQGVLVATRYKLPLAIKTN